MCVCVCVCVFIKLHITTQSGPVVFIKLHITAQSGPVIQSFYASRIDPPSVCVCVCFFSSHSFWTSISLDVPAGVAQEEGQTGFFIHLLSAARALNFHARRIQPSFPSSTVESNFVF